MGEAKRKKLYLEAVEYAKECAIPLEIAIRRVKVFDIWRKNYRKASKCPKCNMYELTIDSSDCEYNFDSWVYCSGCDYTSDIHKKYEPLTGFYGFDIVSAMSSDREREFGDDWESFALKDTIEIEKECGVTRNL